MEIDEITAATIGAAMKVHSALGPGLLESAYEACLVHALRKDGFKAETQIALPVVFDGVKIDAGYRIDLLVEDAVIVELKAVEKILPIYRAQLISYLKLGGKQVGLLINFHELHLRDGIERMVNKYPLRTSASSAVSISKGNEY